METVTRLDQKKSLGCNLSNSTFFGKMLYVNQTFYKDRYVYLFFY